MSDINFVWPIPSEPQHPTLLYMLRTGCVCDVETSWSFPNFFRGLCPRVFFGHFTHIGEQHDLIQGQHDTMKGTELQRLQMLAAVRQLQMSMLPKSTHAFICYHIKCSGANSALPSCVS